MALTLVLGHALAALLFGALAAWQLARGGRGAVARLTVLGLAATACWALVIAIGGVPTMASRSAETARNIAWLALLGALFVRTGAGGRDARRPMVAAVYVAVAATLAAQLLVDVLPAALDPVYRGDFVLPSRLLRMTATIGSLLLAHNLYAGASPATRWSIGMPLAALGGMWAWDLNLYTVAVLLGRPPLLFAARGGFVAALAPLFALALLRGSGLRVKPSRTATFRSLTLLAVAVYLAAMVAAVKLVRPSLADHAALPQWVALIAALGFGALLLPSPRARAWLHVQVTKHLFEHRYDWRGEWLRFTATLGHADAAQTLEERAVRAIADITESPAALLLLPGDAEEGLVAATRWNWPTLDAPGAAAPRAFADYLAASGRIVELDAVREGRARETVPVPAWLVDAPDTWALVPLVHGGRLAGIALLARPQVARSLDWEDFDLLRAAGRQVASHLAEARAAEGLADARRFDEFNRRFAFVVHDIKNLVSQIGLVARNAERHADNPAFHADMVETLNGSVSKMHELLARLSQHNRARAEPPRPVSLRAIAEAVAAPRRCQHPVRIEGRATALVLADPARLEQALGHLLQNAIDASGPGNPVTLRLADDREGGSIAVVDAGAGMSAEFVRTRLFRPFSSTKPDGFGVGALEARSLVEGMGGRLAVESRSGEGTCFTIALPWVEAAPVAEPLRMIA